MRSKFDVGVILILIVRLRPSRFRERARDRRRYTVDLVYPGSSWSPPGTLTNKHDCISIEGDDCIFCENGIGTLRAQLLGI
jgi:hypothetical protein